MCQCTELPQVIGGAQAAKLYFTENTTIVTGVTDVALSRCKSCGTYWEDAPCSPYWCVATEPRRPGSSWPPRDTDPKWNKGFVYQKRYIPPMTITEWQRQMLARDKMREEKLQKIVEDMLGRGYYLLEQKYHWADFARKVEVTVPKQGWFGSERKEMRKEKVFIGVDMLGRQYYRIDDVRGGEDKNESWVM